MLKTLVYPMSVVTITNQLVFHPMLLITAPNIKITITIVVFLQMLLIMTKLVFHPMLLITAVNIKITITIVVFLQMLVIMTKLVFLPKLVTMTKLVLIIIQKTTPDTNQYFIQRPIIIMDKTVVHMQVPTKIMDKLQFHQM